MNQPKELRKIVVQGKEKQNKLSKLCLAFFAASQMFFGFHFGITNVINRKYKTAINFTTNAVACVSIITLIAHLIITDGLHHILMFINAIQYSVTFFILISAEYSPCEFLLDVITTDKRPTINVKHNIVRLVSWIFNMSLFVLKFASVILYVTSISNSNNYIVEVFMTIPILGLDVIPIINALLFYQLFMRIRDLNMRFERQEINLQELKVNYKTVADNFEKLRKKYDAVYICRLVTDCPKWMMSIWQILLLMKSSNSCWLCLVFFFFWGLQVTIEICVPAVFAEMINVETDAMKMTLKERVLLEKDETEVRKLVLLSDYVKSRPLVRKAWRLVPLDLQLPVTVLSMCTTYLIVIIQFAHLYD